MFDLGYQRSVVRSAEFDRIYRLPRRQITPTDEFALALTKKLKTPESTMRLWPIQAVALYEAYKQKGLFGSIGVGFGKSLICLLLPVVMDAKKTVLMVPSQLKDQAKRDAENLYCKNFLVPLGDITIISYNDLSLAKTANILSNIQPDLIVADEVHSLKNADASRTKRFLRYFKEQPQTMFAALSGTMTSKSIKDYAHTLRLALGVNNSPLPNSYSDMVDWSGALDSNPREPVLPGSLMNFCLPGEPVRSGFRRRLIETPGVIATQESAIGTALEIIRKPIIPPKEVTDAIIRLRNTWRIDDEEIELATDAARHLHTLSLGFYYVWDWPGGVKDQEWLDARSAWCKVVRHIMQYRARTALDSPALIAEAAQRDELKPSEQDAWASWGLVKHRPEPPRKVVWISNFLLDYVTNQEPGTIIWYQWGALEEPLRALGIPVYGADADSDLATEPVIACSFGSQGTGKNLQHRYHRNLFTSWPQGGKLTEQVIGRTHRPLQPKDLVTVEWLAPTSVIESDYWASVRDASYSQGTQDNRQKILLATRINEPEKQTKENENG